MWSLSKAEVSGKELKKPDISAPTKFSYHCNEGLKFGDNSTSVVLGFKRLQVRGT